MAKPAKQDPLQQKVVESKAELAAAIVAAERAADVTHEDDPNAVWRLDAESGAEVTLNVFTGRVQVRANGPHAPLCLPARLTLAEAEALSKQLGKACAKLRGIAARAS